MKCFLAEKRNEINYLINLQVVTTFGPKKPQRNPTGSISGMDHIDSEHCQLLAETQPCSPKFPNSQRKLCLETSFTSLQSPSIENHSSSLNSSITNGYYSSKSQTSPIQLTSIITILDEKLKSRPPDRKNLSLNLPAPRNELTTKKIDLIYDDWFGLAPLASPESLSEVSSISSRASFAFQIEKSNLQDIFSDSYELRTPKVMRRTPKIAGNLSTCADDLKSVRYFQKLGQNSKVFRTCLQNENSYTSSGDLSYESATSISLTRCCSKDDQHFTDAPNKCCGIEEEEDIIAEVQIIEGQTNSNSENSDSFQSAENILDCDIIINSKLVQIEAQPKQIPSDPPRRTVYMETHFDEEIFRDATFCPSLVEDEQKLISPSESRSSTVVSSSVHSNFTRAILRSPTCSTPMELRHYLPNSSSKKSCSPQILSPSTPQEIDPDLMANLAIDLNLDEENRSMQFCNPALIATPPTKASSVDSGSICRTPSESKNVTFNTQVINIDPKFVSRTSSVSSDSSPNRSLRWLSKKTEKWHLLPGRATNKSKSAKKIADTNHSPSKIRNDDDQCFSKNESLPLLKGLTGANSEKTSPNFVRRKKYVYPITSISKGESSV